MFGSIGASSALTAAGEIGSSLVGGLLGASSARRQNRYAREEAERSRNFTQKMMMNRHRWQVEDLKRAGLNPVLSANQGAPIGSSPMAPVVGEIEGASTGINSAVAALGVKRQRAEIKNIKASEELTKEQFFTEKVKQAALGQQANSAHSTATVNYALEKIHKLQEKINQAEYNKSKIDAGYYNSEIGKITRQLELGGRSITPIINSGAGVVGASRIGRDRNDVKEIYQRKDVHNTYRKVK